MFGHFTTLCMKGLIGSRNILQDLILFNPFKPSVPFHKKLSHDWFLYKMQHETGMAVLDQTI